MMEMDYLKEALLREYGGEAEKILAGLSCRRRTTLRVNTLKADRGRVEEELRAAGLSFSPVQGLPDALVLPSGSESAVRKLAVYENGEIYLQSLSSMLPPLFLGAEAGEDVLDMAAAPGGKTSQLAQLTGGQAFITACEINHIRAERMKSNLKKLGCGRVNVIERDARKLDDFLRFDRILLDAPCSGSGTLDLTDEGSCKAFSEKLVHNSARLQKELIRKAVRLLKPGGTLLYSTCSLLREENAESAGEMKKLGLLPDPITLEGVEGLRLLDGGLPGSVTVCPNEFFEGFFMARYKKAP